MGQTASSPMPLGDSVAMKTSYLALVSDLAGLSWMMAMWLSCSATIAEAQVLDRTRHSPGSAPDFAPRNLVPSMLIACCASSWSDARQEWIGHGPNLSHDAPQSRIWHRPLLPVADLPSAANAAPSRFHSWMFEVWALPAGCLAVRNLDLIYYLCSLTSRIQYARCWVR